MATTPLATLPSDQIIYSSGGVWFGTTASPDDSAADFIYTPSGAGKSFVVGSSATQPFIVRQVGGTVNVDQVNFYHDGQYLWLDNQDATGGFRFRSDAGGTPTSLLVIGYDGVTPSLSVSGKMQCVASLGFGGSADGGGFARLATGVVKVVADNDGNSGGWLQQPSGHKMLDANATSTSNTLADTNLTWTLKAGRSYSIKLKLSSGNSVAAEGAKFALTSDGTLSATSFDMSSVAYQGTVVGGTVRVTSLGTPLTFTTITQPTDLIITGTIKVNVGGVLKLQIATNAYTSGTFTLNAGTWGEFNDMVAV